VSDLACRKHSPGVGECRTTALGQLMYGSQKADPLPKQQERNFHIQCCPAAANPHTCDAVPIHIIYQSFLMPLSVWT
jgi:hypothetical protein